MDNYGLDSFIVADEINKVIDYNVESKLDRVNRDKHIRGIAGTIEKDVCDVYIYNATTPIENTKINTGVNIFENDDIYLLAINGNLNNLVVDANVHNFEKLFGYKFTDYMLIDGFQDVTACTPLMEWSDLTNDIVYKKYRGQGIRQEFLNPVTKIYAMAKSSLTLDLTSYPDGEATNSSNDYIGIAFYVSDNTMYKATDYLSVVLATTGSDFYIITINSGNHTLVNGWNVYSILKNDIPSGGSPDWSNITELYYENNIDDGYDGEYIVYGVLSLFRNDVSGSASITTNDLLGTSNEIVVTNGTASIVASSDVTLSLPSTIYNDSFVIGRDADNYMDFTIDNVISFKTNGTADRFIIDSNGSIGIATNDIDTTVSGYNIVQFPYAQIFFGESARFLAISNNAYIDASGNTKYRSTGTAFSMAMNDSGFNIVNMLSGNQDDNVEYLSNLIYDYEGNFSIVSATPVVETRFKVFNNGNIGMNQDALPSWDNGMKYLGFPNSSIIYGESTSRLEMYSNAYLWDDLSYYYNYDGAASDIILDTDGSISFRVAPYSTLGSSLTWTTALTIESDGNIGIMTTDIEAWQTGFNALQFPFGGLMYSDSSIFMALGNNDYWDGAYKYRSNDYAQKIRFNTDGTIALWVAPSGTIDTAITFKEALKINNDMSTIVYSIKRYDQQITDVTEERVVKHMGLTETKGQVWISLGNYENEQKITAIKYVGGGICYGLTSPTGYIIKSIDYGNTWFEISQWNDGAYVFNSFDYCGNGIFISGSTNGKMYKSEDWGETWTLKHTITSEIFVYDTTYIGNGIILAISADNGTLVRSDDYGESWATRYTFGSATFYYHNITYCGNGIVLANGHSGNIIRSWDYGYTWEIATKPSSSDDFRDLQYCGNGIVLALLDTNELYKSFDFGETWNLVVDLNATYSIVQSYSLGYVGDGIVLLGAYDTSLKLLIYQSVDYGETWTFFYNNINTLYVADFEYLENGVILAGTWKNSTNSAALLRSSIDYHQYQKYIETTDNIQCNSLILGATPVLSATPSAFPENMLIIQQNLDPTVSEADQIALFATEGDDCTIGLRVEREVVEATPTADNGLVININGSLYMLPLQAI